MKTLIRNGRIITAIDDYHADFLIEHEQISLIGARLAIEADRVIDATGKLVIPGGIDPIHIWSCRLAARNPPMTFALEQ